MLFRKANEGKKKFPNNKLSDNIKNIYSLLDFKENSIEPESLASTYLPFADKLRRMGMVDASIEFYQKIIYNEEQFYLV